MRHSQFLSNLAEISRNTTLVLHHARTTDHLQISDFRQIGENFILHTVSEKGVLFFVTQIVEWENGDTFLRGGGNGGSSPRETFRTRCRRCCTLHVRRRARSQKLVTENADYNGSNSNDSRNDPPFICTSRFADEGCSYCLPRLAKLLGHFRIAKF